VTATCAPSCPSCPEEFSVFVDQDAATGLLDYIELSETDSNDVRLAARHGVRTSVVWCTMCIKLIVAALSGAGSRVLWGGLVVDLLASALLLQGALFGTRIAYGGFKR
jgi:hypothetical protein